MGLETMLSNNVKCDWCKTDNQNGRANGTAFFAKFLKKKKVLSLLCFCLLAFLFSSTAFAQQASLDMDGGGVVFNDDTISVYEGKKVIGTCYIEGDLSSVLSTKIKDGKSGKYITLARMEGETIRAVEFPQADLTERLAVLEGYPFCGIIIRDLNDNIDFKIYNYEVEEYDKKDKEWKVYKFSGRPSEKQLYALALLAMWIER